MAANGWREYGDREPRSLLPNVSVVATLRRFAGMLLEDTPRVRTRSVLWHRSEDARPVDMQLSEFMSVELEEKHQGRGAAVWPPKLDWNSQSSLSR